MSTEVTISTLARLSVRNYDNNPKIYIFFFKSTSAHTIHPSSVDINLMYLLGNVLRVVCE